VLDEAATSTHPAPSAYEIAVHLVGAKEITRLNATFLSHEGPTDVITFDYSQDATQGKSVMAAQTVAQVSKPAGPPISKSAAGATSCAGPVWKPAIQQARSPALRSQPETPWDAPSSRLSGEIFICVDEAVSQSRHFSTQWQSELVRYLIHGVLHLQGYDDLKPALRQKMKRQEDRVLKGLSRRFDWGKLAAGIE
jgi:rRNA maturation RNase YbeY